MPFSNKLAVLKYQCQSFTFAISNCFYFCTATACLLDTCNTWLPNRYWSITILNPQNNQHRLYNNRFEPHLHFENKPIERSSHYEWRGPSTFFLQHHSYCSCATHSAKMNQSSYLFSSTTPISIQHDYQLRPQHPEYSRMVSFDSPKEELQCLLPLRWVPQLCAGVALLSDSGRSHPLRHLRHKQNK